MNDKIINSKCICKKGLSWVNLEVIMIEPCEHLIHLKCLKKYGHSDCPYCNVDITDIVRLKDFKKNPNLYQKCIDILSVTNYNHKSKINIENVILNIPTLIGTLTQLPFTVGRKSGLQLCSDVFSMNNIKIVVNGLEKIKNEKKVFICNHTSHYDFFIIFYILNTGFLSTTSIKKNIFSKQLLNVIPLLLVNRGKKSNSVENMRKYIEKHGSICLFPEGMLTHPDTIGRFRTGAFHVGYPVYPIVLKYKKCISDSNIQNFIMKMASSEYETIEMNILDPFYPPFDDKKIETVRRTMADKCELLLSRISNRDIID